MTGAPALAAAPANAPPDAARLYLSLMIAYGVGNMANDAWYEQVVKRGWIDWRIPSVLQPEAHLDVGPLIVAGAAIFFTAFQPRRDHAANPPREPRDLASRSRR